MSPPVTTRCTARYVGESRMCGAQTRTPGASAASSSRRSASGSVVAIGFSTSTCLPARSAVVAISPCSRMLVSTSTASTPSSSTRSRQLATSAGTSQWPATHSCFARSMSCTAVTCRSPSRCRASDIVAYGPACDPGRAQTVPRPTTPRRTVMRDSWRAGWATPARIYQKRTRSSRDDDRRASGCAGRIRFL